MDKSKSFQIDQFNVNFPIFTIQSVIITEQFASKMHQSKGT